MLASMFVLMLGRNIMNQLQRQHKLKQESFPVGCILPTCKLYVLQRPPPDVTPGGVCTVRSNRQVWRDFQRWPPDVTSRKAGSGTGGTMPHLWGLESGQGLGLGVEFGSGVGVLCLMSWVWCIVGNGHKGTPTSVNKQTRLKILPSYNSVGGW